MAFLIGRGSAVEWLRHNDDIEPLSVRYALPYSGLEGSRTRLERHLAHFDELTKPYQLIVWTERDRRRSAVAQCHVLTTHDGRYPAIRVDRGLFCSPPEFAFVQMALLLGDEALRFLGCELCGRYGINLEDKVFLREQTCTPDMLRRQAEALPGIRGRKRALAIAPTVLAGAASPMEVSLALILSTPCEQGGYGIEPPELNHALPVRGAARRLWVDDRITPDLLWERAKLCIEYDSELHHMASERIADDAVRRDVLQELGYRVITVTWEHLKSFKELERIADIVAQSLGFDCSTADEEILNTRAAFQARMRRLATHSEDLLALSADSSEDKRSWHGRYIRQQ